MKALIAYYSFTGNNELLARELQNNLSCDIYRITEIRKRHGFSIMLDVLFKRDAEIKETDIQLSHYEHILLLGPVWAGGIASPLKTFLKREKDNIREYSFISLCGGGGNKNLAEELNSLAGKKPVSIMELAVNDLLPAHQKYKIKYTSGYRVQQQDLKAFKESINRFLHEAMPAEMLTAD